MSLTAFTDLLGQGAVVGAHLLSLNSPAAYPTKVDIVGQPAGYEQAERATLGAYVRLANGLTAGAQRNVYHQASAYLGYTFQTADGRFALTVGGATGYASAKVAPLVVPSMRLGLDGLGAIGWSARLSAVPTSRSYGNRISRATALQLSVEVAL